MIPVDPRPRPMPRRDRGRRQDDLPATRFGRSRAAHSLEAILSELADPALARRLVHHHTDFLHGLNQLDHVPNPRFRKWFIERFARMVREHLTGGEVARSDGRARDAWTHLVCVLAAAARDRVRAINAELHEAWLEATREERALRSRRDRARARAR